MDASTGLLDSEEVNSFEQCRGFKSIGKAKMMSETIGKSSQVTNI